MKKNTAVSAKKGRVLSPSYIRFHYKNESVVEEGIKRNDIVVLRNSEGVAIRRIAILTVNLVKQDQFAVDYESLHQLGLKQDTVCELAIKKGSRLDGVLFVWSHPDGAIRVGARSAVWLTVTALVAGEIMSIVNALVFA